MQRLTIWPNEAADSNTMKKRGIGLTLASVRRVLHMQRVEPTLTIWFPKSRPEMAVSIGIRGCRLVDGCVASASDGMDDACKVKGEDDGKREGISIPVSGGNKTWPVEDAPLYFGQNAVNTSTTSIILSTLSRYVSEISPLKNLATSQAE
ncbi:hypothetical protein BDZ97DRAFT_1754416 [Flammula alnicola]|nr:hypothetical protein BDZ97DRAFT_1754416 [Flammula alnicola]